MSEFRAEKAFTAWEQIIAGLVFRRGHKPVGGYSGNGQSVGHGAFGFLEMYLRHPFKYRKNFGLEALDLFHKNGGDLF
jgi:hypothetical protein